jgi:anti-anti-sigma factor
MLIKVEAKDDITICRLEGDVNINTAPEIKKAITELVDQKPPKLIVNLSKVKYIDSSGLAVMVEMLKRVKGYGGRLKLTGLSPMIKSMFEIIQFNKIFDIVATEENAITAFK